jgi:hypothetical protein
MMFQDMLGLSPDETDALIRQQVGLAISPGEELAASVESRGILADMMKPLIAQQTAREEITSREKIATGKKEEGLARVQAYRERTAELNQLDPAEAFKFSMERAFADKGVYDEDGSFTPLTDEQQQRVGQILGIVQANPGVTAGVMRILDSPHIDMDVKQDTLSKALGLPLEIVGKQGFLGMWGAPIFGEAEVEQVDPMIPETMSTDEATMMIMQEILKELQ